MIEQFASHYMAGTSNMFPLRERLSTRDALWQSGRMSRNEVIQKLKQHEAELRAAGIVHLHLHGSYARGTQIEPSSDVDLIAEFDSAKRLTLLDLVGLENRLHELLGVRVDLSDATMLKEPVRQRAQREAVLAF